MTARDAAPLLAAVLACSQVRDSVEMVRGYSETYFHNITSGGYGDSPTAALRNLPPDHSFVDAIEALIAAAADRSLEPATYVITAEVEGEKFGYEAIIENRKLPSKRPDNLAISRSAAVMPAGTVGMVCPIHTTTTNRCIPPPKKSTPGSRK